MTNDQILDGGGAQPFLTKTDLAKLLRKNPRTIDNWMKRGLLPYYKIGSAVMFRFADVQAHFDQNFRLCKG